MPLDRIQRLNAFNSYPGVATALCRLCVKRVPASDRFWAVRGDERNQPEIYLRRSTNRRYLTHPLRFGAAATDEKMLERHTHFTDRRLVAVIPATERYQFKITRQTFFDGGILCLEDAL